MTKLIQQLCLAALRGYQRYVSPLLGPRCRFYPSCSHYAISCIQQAERGLFPHAFFKIILRLLKCNPFHPGGVDLP